jgi:Flp pilus assembly protein CpaB
MAVRLVLQFAETGDGGTVRRSNQLVLAGIAFFVVGVVIVLIVGRDSGSSSNSGSNQKVSVLVAKESLAAGSKGSEVIDKVEVQQINAADKLPDALTSPSQLSNYRLVSSFGKGEQILQSGLTLTVASVAVPKGYEAVPIQMSYIAGGAGYVAPGDYVNIYQVIPNSLTAQATSSDQTASTVPYATPRTELLLTKVLVLDVSTQVAPLATQQAGAATPTTTGVQSRAVVGGQIIMLVAVDTVDAEKVIFGSQVQGLYLYVSKVDKDGNPAGPTPGQDELTILQQEANDAYAANPPK